MSTSLMLLSFLTAALLAVSTLWDDSAVTEPGTAIPDAPGNVRGPETRAGASDGDLGEPMVVKAGIVTVTTQLPNYSIGQGIDVVVANGLNLPIFVEDMKSACSIVILERMGPNGWRPILDCPSERLPRVVVIGSGYGRTVRLTPSIDGIGAAEAESGERSASGLYRVRFTYRLTHEPAGEEPYAVESGPFRIGP